MAELDPCPTCGCPMTYEGCEECDALAPYFCHTFRFTIVPHGVQLDFASHADDEWDGVWCRDYGSSDTGRLVSNLLKAIGVNDWDGASEILASIQKEES